MAFLGLILVVLAAWLIFTGRLQRMTTMDGMMLGIAIVGAIAARANPAIGWAPLAVAAIYAARRFIRHKRLSQSSAARKKQPASDRGKQSFPTAQQVQEARALLGVDKYADAQAIRAAHRRLIAKIHPDAGGTQALAEKINDARSILLRHIDETTGSNNS